MCFLFLTMSAWDHRTFLSHSVSCWWDRGEALSLVWKTLEHEPSLYLALMKVGWHAAMTSGSGAFYALTTGPQIECVAQIVLRMKSLWWKSRMGWDIASFLPFCCCIMNMHTVESVSLCVLMCVVMCELSQTPNPPDLCLCRLISAAHKGVLCATRDRLSGQWVLCVTTPSPTEANRYAPFSPEIIGKTVLAPKAIVKGWSCWGFF